MDRIEPSEAYLPMATQATASDTTLIANIARSIGGQWVLASRPGSSVHWLVVPRTTLGLRP